MSSTESDVWWKVVRPDGRDFYSGTVDWVDAIGHRIVVCDDDGRELTDPAYNNHHRYPARLCTPGVLHASRVPLAPLSLGARLPARWIQVEGDPVCQDSQKAGFRELHPVREMTGAELDRLLGFKACEAMSPLHPFTLPPPTITNEHEALLRQWASVWASVRDSVWASVRDSVWASVWDSVGASVWASVGASVWASVGASVWASVGAYIGSLFPDITSWRYVNHEEGVYPFQAAADLWRQGLVPSFDGKTWRLHGGLDGRVLHTVVTDATTPRATRPLGAKGEVS